MPLNKFLNKINKIFILKNALLLVALFLIFSCSDEGCVEADDFGDMNSQTITVYSNVVQNSCDYDSSVSFEKQKSMVLVSCLTTSSQSITGSDGTTTYSSTTGCAGITNLAAQEFCRLKCISDCQEQFSGNGTSQPSWVSTKPRLKNSSIGVNISPNSEITITAKGSIALGKDIDLSSKFVKFNEIMPNSYGDSSFLSQSALDVGNGQSISLKFSKSSNATVEGPSSPLNDDINFTRRLVAYVVPHPIFYKYNYSENNPTNAVINAPLSPRFNGWKCVYASTNLTESSCSSNDDNYSSDPNPIVSTDLYPNANDALSSLSFDVSSSAKKIIDYGGFIRWNNDKVNNYSYNPFLNTNCNDTGICYSLPDSKEGIIVGDISSDFAYYNNDGSAKELSFKMLGSFCPTLTISRLSVFDKTNREIYYINNFQINSSYSSNKIPFNQGYKLILTSNLANYNTANCGKFLAMRILKYQDILVNRSGFVSLRIVDNNTAQSNSPSCNISARIINPNGIHNVINDSSTLIDNQIYQSNSSAMNLIVPPSGITVNVNNSYYGTVTLNSDGTNFLTGNTNCFQNINSIVNDTYVNCITNGQATCALSNSDARLNSLNLCSTGNGSDGSKNTNPSGGGTGGGGGGNDHGQSFSLDSTGFGKGAQSGSSYFSDYYNQAKPTASTISLNGSGGIGGFDAQNGQVKIYNCDASASCTPTVFDYNSSTSYYDYNVPASGTIRYEIVGGGGGGGGNNCGTASQTSGATGANSIKFSGVFKNVSASKTSRLRIYIGGGGSAGYSNCSNSNYINKVAYNNGFSSTSQNISLSADASQNISKIIFASYGYPVIKNRSTQTTLASDASKFEINPFCHSRASKVVAVDNCIGRNNCSINLADSNFNSLDTNICNSGNGSSGASNTSSDNNGSGGGGGGGNGSGGSSAAVATAGIISGGNAGAPGGSGTSGDSYYDPAYHSTQPSITSSVNGGSSSGDAGDGSVQITDGGSVLNYTTPGTFYITASSSSITYVIKGAGGGSGGNYSISKQGGTGASGSQLSGTITVNSGDQIRIDVAEKGQKGAGSCIPPQSYAVNEGSTINLAGLISGTTTVNSSYYGTLQRTSDTAYTTNTYCNIDTLSNINSQLSNTSFLISNANLGTPAVCSSGDGSSASTASVANTGGGGGGGGGNGYGTSGIINAGTVTNGSAGGAGNSAESFYNAYYSSTPTSTSSTNGANSSSTSAGDGLAILKATSSTADASAYINLSSALSGTYTATANGTIYYKIRGAGGGKGSKNLSSQTANPGNGASGNELIGNLNIKNGDVIKVFVGKAGTNGLNCDTTSHFGNVNEFSKLTLSIPSPGMAAFNFANYGTPTTSSTPYTANASCSLNLTTNTSITSCLGQTTCSVYATNLTLGSNPCAPTATQNQYAIAGTNYTGTSSNQGGGGGGGGGGSYQQTLGGSATPGVMSGAGKTGPSYYNPNYIPTTPLVSIGGGAGGSRGSGSTDPNADGFNGGSGGNGSIQICDSNGSSNCSSFNSPGVYEVTIPSNSQFYFSVKGGGGGGGSPNINTTNPVGGNGANGSYVYGVAQNNLSANDKIYVYVGGGGGGGVASRVGSRIGGSVNTSSLYFLGAKGGDANQTFKGTGGAGGSASFIIYKGVLVALASGGGGGGGGGEEQSAYSYVNGEDATTNATLNSSGASFTYTLKKLAIEGLSGNQFTKGVGGNVSSYLTFYQTNILKGGDGSETRSGANCVGGGGGGGGGGTLITINDEVVAIAGGGGGGGGTNSSTAGNSASLNTTISTTLKVAPAKKKLVINYSQNITTPTPTSSDTLLLGGDGGTINKSSTSYCSNNSNGQGGSGGGATMLSINNRVIAIAGGGGGGGGASTNGTDATTKNATNNNYILDKLKAGPFGKYMAVAFEYRNATSGIINVGQQSSGNLSIPALPANSVINDVAFASFGENSISPFYYAGNCSKEEVLKTALETNCLFRNSCISTIAISASLKAGLSCTPSTNIALAKLTYHIPNQSSTPAKNNSILRGGNGGAMGLKECSGGGGSGGGASAISVLTNSDFTSASEHFVAIAGGGGGGGGASCDGTGATDASGISRNTVATDLINGLNNTSLGKWFSGQISFPRFTPRVIPEDFYEYDDFSIPDDNSSDPLKSLTVNNSAFVPMSGSNLLRNKIFVRKGQIIRFSPKSWDSTWTTKNGLVRQCGIGMALQVEPRPALICIGSRVQNNVLNPTCLQNVDIGTSGSITLSGCKPDNKTASALCNNPSKLCTAQCFKKIVCTGTPSKENLFSNAPCTVSNELETATGCATTGGINDPTNCTACNEARKIAAELPYYLPPKNYDNCYDLEDYEGKIYNVIANASDESKINDLINNKKLKILSGFNGVYGSLENFNIISSNNYETKYPLTSSIKGRMKFMIADGYDLNIPNFAGATYTNFYSNNDGYVTISPSLSLTGRNGDWLQIKLCKESSSSSYDCKSLNMASANDLSNSNSPNPSILQITPQSQIAFDSINYAFDSKGTLFRTTDPISSKDCSPANVTNSVGGLAGGAINSATSLVDPSLGQTANSILDPNSIVTTSKFSKFYCHTDQTSVDNLRLSFKIFDPEVENCNLANGSSTAPLNGVRINNIKYSASASNDNQTCSQSESASNSCGKQFSCVEKYSNNSGSYEVKIKVKNNRGISQIVNNIVQPIIYWMDGNSASSNPQERIGIVEKIYKSLISNPKYKLILKLSLVLFIMFYGLGYLMGVSELSQAEIVTRVFKIGFIYLFVGENGWVWFKEIFVNIFKEGVMQASFLMASSFDNSTQLEDAIQAGNYSNTALLFGSVDKVISMLFSSAVNKKIWAFLFTGIFGWAYVLVFYFSILNYIYALSNAVLLFVTAQIMISILFVIGPLFFIFLLFSQTKDMFDNWLKALVGFGLQLIFLITTLTFFNMLMVEVLKMALGYKVCWDDAWIINLGSRITLTQFWTIPTLPPRTNMGEDIMNTGSPDGIPSFFSIIYIWVIASLTTRMVTFMTDAASTISEGIKASGMSSGIKQAASALKKGAASLAKSQIWDKTVGKALDRLDNKLFASGKTAKKERQEKREQANEDMSIRRELGNAADKAENNFNKNPDNIKSMNNMSPEEQKNKINQVRQDAMDKRGDQLGLDKEDVKRIANDKGLKYYGTNIFGAGFKGLKQGIFKGGALVNPIAEKNNNQLSRKAAENAIMNMNQEEREKFAQKVADGEINVKRNLKEKLKRNPLKAGKEKIDSALRKLNHNFNPLNQDFKKAAKELQDEGKIIPDLNNMGRNDKEKALIRERMNQNRDKEKRIGKKTVAKSLLKKGNRDARKKLLAQKDNLRKLLGEDSDRADLEELDDKINDAFDNIDNLDPDDADNAEQIDNAKEVLDQFAKIDNLKDKDKVEKFLDQDNVKNIKNNSDA